MAAPLVLIGVLDHMGAHWVEVNITGEFLQVFVRIDQNCLVALLEQMAGFVVSPVEPLDIPKRDALDNF